MDRPTEQANNIARMVRVKKTTQVRKRSDNYRAKERIVWHFLSFSYPEVPWVHDKVIPGNTSRKRPDISTLFHDNLVLIIEIDEFQHSGPFRSKFYNKEMEKQRVMALKKDCGERKLIMIRFNPDFYRDSMNTVNNGIFRNDTEWDIQELGERFAVLAHEVDQAINTVNNDKPDLHVRYLFFDGYDRKPLLNCISPFRIRAATDVALQMCSKNFPLHRIRHLPAAKVFNYVPRIPNKLYLTADVIQAGKLKMKYIDLDVYVSHKASASKVVAPWVQRRKRFDRLLEGCPPGERAVYWDTVVAPRMEAVDQLERWMRNMMLEVYCTRMPIDDVIQMYVPQDDVLQHNTALKLRYIRELAEKLGVSSFTVDRMEIPRGKVETVAEELLAKRATYASTFGFGKASRCKGDDTRKQGLGLVNTILHKWGIFEVKSAASDGDNSRKMKKGQTVYTGADRVRFNEKLKLPEGMVKRLMGTMTARVNREMDRLAAKKAERTERLARLAKDYGEEAVRQESESMARSMRNLRQDEYAEDQAWMDAPQFVDSSDDDI